LLDDGRLTDSQGRVVNFKNTIVIMTSNIGTEHVLEGHSQEEISRRIQEALQANLRPEFLNRIDETIIFNRLDREGISRIVEIQISGLIRRLAEKHIELVLDESAKVYLGQRGYDPAYGARPLKRVVQKLLQDRIALELLTGDIKEGDTVHVTFDEKADELVFR
jgi:ATP-dependent Clp protease ATP-binding subunit ClpB